jgi:hypothetical protein
LVKVNNDKKNELKELVELVKSPIKNVFGVVEVNNFWVVAWFEAECVNAKFISLPYVNVKYEIEEIGFVKPRKRDVVVDVDIAKLEGLSVADRNEFGVGAVNVIEHVI